MQDLGLEQALIEHVREQSWFSTDNRTFQPGDVFIALRGEKDDGHRYLDKLVDPALLVVEAGHPLLAKLPPSYLAILCEVDKTQDAHRQVAAFFRKRFYGHIIAVGGSNGKTTTKDCLAHVLRRKFRCAATKKSQNGELGIPKTLELLRPGIELGILEVGIDAPGDMQRHCELIQANLGVITSIGEEHLQELGDIETVFREETELFRAIQRQGGLTWIPKDDPYLARLASEPGIQEASSYQGQGSLSFVNPLAMRSLGLVQAVAQHLGMSRQEIEESLQDFHLPPGRGNILDAWKGTLIIADFYNANPSSLQASLEAAVLFANQKKLPLHLILGDMLDLGNVSQAKHLALGSILPHLQANSLCLIGHEMETLRDKLACRHYSTVEDARLEVDQIFQAEGIYLIKGSRGVHLERLIEEAFRKKQLPLTEAWKRELAL